MEVHHHPDLAHKEKPWKEYLLEGLMIFIAVTLGFFAENIRENIAEKHKKKETLEAVAYDLERDIKLIDTHIELNKNRLRVFDSLNKLIQLPPEKIDQQIYYRLIVELPDAWNFTSNNKSRIEAESKGYISNTEDKEIAANISEYEFFVNDLDQWIFKIDMATLTNFINNQVAKYVDADLYEISSRSPVVDLPSKIGIKKISTEDVKNLRIHIANKRFIVDNYINEMKAMKKFAHKTINLIHKKYN